MTNYVVIATVGLPYINIGNEGINLTLEKEENDVSLVANGWYLIGACHHRSPCMVH